MRLSPLSRVDTERRRKRTRIDTLCQLDHAFDETIHFQ